MINMLSTALPGDHAPHFSLAASGGQHVMLEEYRGRWLVLCFYPRDFTRNCPTELLDFSHRAAEFAGTRAEILAISTDSAEVHDAWIRTPVEHGGLGGSLRFPLGADVTHHVCEAYGVYDARHGCAHRALFLIDPDGVVQYQAVHNPRLGRSAADVLRILETLQSGGACPWPGEDETE